MALRLYTAADEAAAIELWRRTWSQHYPHIDFDARVGWWRERWRNELVPACDIVVAESGGALAGFVTVDPNTQYLDQIVVAPEHWGSGVARDLLDEAKRRSPAASPCSSTRTMPAPSVSTADTTSSMTARTRTRSPASPSTGCAGGREKPSLAL